MNTNDPIDDMFRDNQHGLDEKPRDLIWDRIEERLDKKSVQEKKIQWWKYATAASVVAGMILGVWALINNPDSVSKPENSTQIVYEAPTEINEENASELLDKLEENKQSVAIREEKKPAPDVIENEMEPTAEPISLKIPKPVMKQEPVYDVAPMEEISAAPAMESSKKLEEGEVVVFQGESKKEDNYALQSKPKSQKYEKEDTRRLGNSYFVPEADSSNTDLHSINILLKDKTIRYNLVSKSDSIYIYENAEIAYPKHIIFRKLNDSVLIIYTGKENKRKSKESEEIQKFVKENKTELQNRFLK